MPELDLDGDARGILTCKWVISATEVPGVLVDSVKDSLVRTILAAAAMYLGVDGEGSLELAVALLQHLQRPRVECRFFDGD